MARYQVIPHKDDQGRETGQYVVVDANGNVVAGPFPSFQEALDWIEENNDEPTGPETPATPSPGF